MMDWMMEKMLGGMDKEEKEEMMDGMMGRFMADFSKEDKMELMSQMMPKMMEDINMLEMMPRMMVTMMPKMISEVKDIIEDQDIDFKEFMAGTMNKVVPVIMEGINKDSVVEHKEEMMSVMMDKDCIRQHMPQMQCRMMPGCTERMLPNLPKEQRIEFMQKMVDIFKEQGALDMDDGEKRAFLDSLKGKLS
jgi:hypothetical protein